MIVILDHNEAILEWMDDADASIEITDTYTGYVTLDFECELTDVKRDEYLFRQGNKLLIEGILFVMNTEVEIDYVHNTISLEAEEVLCELNNCEPFYVGAPRYSRYTSGNTVSITKNFLAALLDGFYVVDNTDLPGISDSLKYVTVNGTITKYKLLKEIESNTGLVFKRTYTLENNSIVKHISLVKPENYGVTHDKLLERVTVGDNTNKLEYKTDETKNALGIMPIIKSENNANVDYTKILRQFYELDINNEKIMPYFENYVFNKDDIVNAARVLNGKIGLYKFLPETINLNHDEVYVRNDYGYGNESGTVADHGEGVYNGIWFEDKIYQLDIGMGQFLDFATQIVLNPELKGDIPIKTTRCPSLSNGNSLDCVFDVEEIQSLALRIQDYISRSGECPSSISTRHGLVSFQWLVYIMSEYLTTGKKVVCKTEDYPKFNKILPSSVEDNVTYIVDYDNYESMPYLYTQNTSESSKIPTVTGNNLGQNNVIDIAKYISETYPILVVHKTATGENQQVNIKISSQGIADKEPNEFFVGFRHPELIKDDTDITIDFSKQTINYTKRYETVVEVQKEVSVTTESQGSSNTITVTGKNTCGCCGYPKMPYKNYTRTYKNKCPNCGREGTLVFGPKNIVDGEITCGNTGPACKNKGTVNGEKVTRTIKGCDADYCCQCGGDKWGGGKCARVKLEPADPREERTVSTETRTETVQEHQIVETEVTASNDEIGDTSDKKEALTDVISENSKLDAFYGDCRIQLDGCNFVSLNSDSCKLYELSPFPYIKKAGEEFIYAPITKASFNYTHMSNNDPKLEPFETSEQSVEEVLIGCWKKLNGSGDNTKWLDKSEDITVDLTEENLDLNAGDFVYIKLPDTLVFKAQIVEKKYDPKIKSDSSLKIGNITRETIL